MNEDGKTSTVDSEPQGRINTEQQEVTVPQEEIKEIVEDFCDFYNTTIPEEKKDFNVSVIKEEEWNEKLLKKEIMSALGVDIPIKVEEETLKKFSTRTIPYGEWISAENRGYLVDLSNTTWNTESKKHVLRHELVHAISRAKNGAFSAKDMYTMLFKAEDEDSEDFFCAEPKKLNEGATEILALGLTLKTKDLEEIKAVISERIQNSINKSENENTLEDQKIYLMETVSLIILMEETEVSLQDLSDYYLTGDRKGFIKKIRDSMHDRYSKVDRFDDEHYPVYSGISNALDNLGIFIKLPE